MQILNTREQSTFLTFGLSAIKGDWRGQTQPELIVRAGRISLVISINQYALYAST